MRESGGSVRGVGRRVQGGSSVWCSGGAATAVSRQEGFSKCNWKDLTPMTHSGVTAHLFMLLCTHSFDRGFSKRTARSHICPGRSNLWDFALLLQALGHASEIPSVPKQQHFRVMIVFQVTELCWVSHWFKRWLTPFPVINWHKSAPMLRNRWMIGYRTIH